MEREEKKRLLISYPYIDASMKYFEKLLRELDADIAAPTAKLTDMPHVQGISNPTQLAGERRAELATELATLRQKKLDIEDGINSMEDLMLRQVIIERFVNGHSQDDTADLMNYSRGYFWKIENKAIDLFEIGGKK